MKAPTYVLLRADAHERFEDSGGRLVQEGDILKGQDGHTVRFRTFRGALLAAVENTDGYTVVVES